MTTAEEAHRSTSACILAWVSMKLGRKLRWDPAKEAFLDDAQANGMRSRPQRAPYGTQHWIEKGLMMRRARFLGRIVCDLICVSRVLMM